MTEGKAADAPQAIYSRASFKGDRGDTFNARAVYTPFSPPAQRSFKGLVVPADPILANQPLRNAFR
eukprot:CAMPEP_0173404322 /NCGR_PEP_ID=MMETSP1356-20130122/59099_1 /TAXON_ID=77927 ORGANISM="Hemiselmis virescens, Strain PCC157" /NCGR_SAMPLE_ID=MMETSP1356 /ASSEMBLY_ACC=CAM_ASM_000847 /LENGTH=65 /DNA_ID=CAMNT_0014364977 /DNA_START=27 /DNA_END=221 /DNA_ORIENTATION=-